MSQYEKVVKELGKHKEVETILPTCADLGSAGDDFYSKETVTIAPKTAHLFWTDVKVLLEQDEVLYVMVRSSIGLKKHLMLSNTIGVIDASYYGNHKNDGNIGISLYNYGEDAVVINAGERIAQGVVHKVVGLSNRNPLSDSRVGGMGSSGK